jgi:hypothetical protein
VQQVPGKDDESSLRGRRGGQTRRIRLLAMIAWRYTGLGCVLAAIFDHTWNLELAQERCNLPALTIRYAATISPIGALDLPGQPSFLDPPELPIPGSGAALPKAKL